MNDDAIAAPSSALAPASDAVKGSEAFRKLILSAKVLWQAVEGCSFNHYSGDYEEFGRPSFLLECQKDIGAAEAALQTAEGELAIRYGMMPGGDLHKATHTAVTEARVSEASVEAAKVMRAALETIADMPPRLTIDQLIDEHSEMRLTARRALDVADLCNLAPAAISELLPPYGPYHPNIISALRSQGNAEDHRGAGGLCLDAANVIAEQCDQLALFHAIRAESISRRECIERMEAEEGRLRTNLLIASRHTIKALADLDIANARLSELEAENARLKASLDEKGFALSDRIEATVDLRAALEDARALIKNFEDEQKAGNETYFDQLQRIASLQSDLAKAREELSQEGIHAAELEDENRKQASDILTLNQILKRQFNELAEKRVHRDDWCKEYKDELTSARSDALANAAKEIESLMDDESGAEYGLMNDNEREAVRRRNRTLLMAATCVRALAKPKDPT